MIILTIHKGHRVDKLKESIQPELLVPKLLHKDWACPLLKPFSPAAWVQSPTNGQAKRGGVAHLSKSQVKPLGARDWTKLLPNTQAHLHQNDPFQPWGDAFHREKAIPFGPFCPNPTQVLLRKGLRGQWRGNWLSRPQSNSFHRKGSVRKRIPKL